MVISGIRELIGSRTLLGYQVLPNGFEPLLVMILPAGAFLTLGLLMGLANAVAERKKKLERQSLIDKYTKPVPSVQLKEQEV